MIKSKKEYKEYLKQDCIANKFGRFKGLNPIFKYIKRMRKVEYLTNCKKSRLSRKFNEFLLMRISVKTGIYIPPNTFGKGLYIPHYGCIVVNGTARFGDNCLIQCGVNISERVSGGNHIYISAGAKILIGVNIADDIIIGANAVVTKSFDEPNIVIAGVPAVKISDKGFASGRDKI